MEKADCFPDPSTVIFSVLTFSLTFIKQFLNKACSQYCKYQNIYLLQYIQDFSPQQFYIKMENSLIKSHRYQAAMCCSCLKHCTQFYTFFSDFGGLHNLTKVSKNLLWLTNEDLLMVVIPVK